VHRLLRPTLAVPVVFYESFPRNVARLQIPEYWLASQNPLLPDGEYDRRMRINKGPLNQRRGEFENARDSEMNEV